VVLSGAATVDQLASNVNAFAVPETAVAEVEGMAEDPAAYWTARSELAWT
jgi:aryl-alcohol dehydrogenase-like predicted oxidoreductase